MAPTTEEMQAKLHLTGESWVDKAFNQIITHSMRLDYEKVCGTALSVINHSQAQAPDRLRAYMTLALSETGTDLAVRYAEKLVELTMTIWGGLQGDRGQADAASAAIALSKNVLSDNRRIAKVERNANRILSMKEKSKLRTGISAAM